MCQGECECKNLGLIHKHPRIFVEPACGGASLFYLIYRWLVCLYFTAIIIYGGIDFNHGVKWFIWFTNWSFLILVCNVLFQAINCTYHYITKRRAGDGKVYKSMPVPFCFSWILQNLTIVTAPLVGIIYWLLVYDGWKLTIINVSTHAVNVIYVALDLLITGIPVRILHIYQPILFIGIYIIFTVAYWAQGGTNTEGNPYIYGVINYEENILTALGYAAGMVLVLAPLMFSIVWVFCRIKVAILKRCDCTRASDDVEETRNP